MQVAQNQSRHAAARVFLRGLKARGVALGLDRMRRFLAEIGDPQNRIPCIHIAGTNGKGSVAAMLEAILRTAGWKTGLYTSPHLVKIGERIQVNRELLSDEELTRAVQELQPIVERIAAASGEEAAPSYFEFMTALAFRQFAASGCDVSVIEVGLGGRLDATNIVTPEVSVITSIGLDHCEVLGDTLEQIAAEKVGIIKPRVPVIIGRLPNEAEQVIRKVAAQNDAPVISIAQVFGAEVTRYPSTSLAGDYQRVNAATATLAARALSPDWRISESAIDRGLAQVSWSGRWQQFAVDGRSVVVDSSHNAEGSTVLDANLRKLVKETGRAPVVVVGVLGVSRAEPILRAVARHAREIRLVVPHQARACRGEQLRALVPDTFRGQVIDDRLDQIFPTPETCTLGGAADTVVVTGSIYLAGEVLARLDPTNQGNDNDLQDF
jgi:dihydrofolate synthase/folylpolyglutamate synthase